MSIRGSLIRSVGGVLFSLSLTLGLLEATLRLAPGLLGGNLANAVYSAFRDWPLGMYVHDPVIRMHFMRPDFATRAYWNGYWWTHRTDAWGFRNPRDLVPGSVMPPYPWIVNNPEEFTAMVAYLQTLGRAKDWRPDKDYER